MGSARTGSTGGCPWRRRLTVVRLLVYTLLRVLLVLAAAGVLSLLGMRSWLLWVTAVVVGALLSYLLLRPQGRAAANVLAEYSPVRAERPVFSPAVEADAAYEDALVDDAEARSAARTPDAVGTLEREPDAQQQAVAELEQPRVAQDRDEVAAGGAAEDGTGEPQRPRHQDEHEQHPR